MIDPRYGLKYSFPHTLVHIVDNSMYTEGSALTVTYDPSLFATIVVTGMPMGVDNQVVTITRSDVLNAAFGADTLTTADIEKYGQAVEYPRSLINQNAPVKLIRITPDDAQYGIVTIYIEWMKNPKTGNLEIRLVQAQVDDIISSGINLAAYKNSERLAKATFSKLSRSAVNNNGWTREVLMTYVSAGRGSAYNNFNVYINPPTLEQRLKYSNVIYNFGTVDTRNQLNIEQFTASMINDSTKLSSYGVVSTIDTVNVQMKKRLEGSSVMVPYVNEAVIRTLYKEWVAIFDDKVENEIIKENVRNVYQTIRRQMDVNMFDVIFGKTVYSGYEIDIPYLTIDTVDTEIPRLSEDHIIKTSVKTANADTTSSGAIDADDVIDIIYDQKIDAYFDAVYGFLDTDNKHSDEIKNNSTAVVPGTMYLVTPSTVPTINIVTGINQYSGAVTIGSFPYIWNLKDGDGNFAEIDKECYKITGSKNNYTSEVDTTQGDNGHIVTKDYASIAKYFDYTYSVEEPTVDNIISFLNTKITAKMNLQGTATDNSYTQTTPTASQINQNTGELITSTKKNKYGSIIAIGYVKTNNIKTFKLYQINEYNTDTNQIISLWEYPENYYAAINYESHYTGTGVHFMIALKSKNVDPATGSYYDISDKKLQTIGTGAFAKTGVLYIDDVTKKYTSTGQGYTNNYQYITSVIETVRVDTNKVPAETTSRMYGTFEANNFKRVDSPPTSVSMSVDYVGETFDIINILNQGDDKTSKFDQPITDLDVIDINQIAATDTHISRYQVTGTALSVFKIANTNIAVPSNYYTNAYGISTVSELGGISVSGGSTGFFDDESLSTIEFKLKYSELLVKAFRGEIDPRILSPVRVPAKFLFDAGYNTVLGIKALPYSDPSVEDVIYASTIFTDEEKEAFASDRELVSGKIQYSDLDVKQAMYDLMIHRVYQGIPEDKRPIGPGSGLQLYLDSGYADIETVKVMNESFKSRFKNPNAVWDVGGYTSAMNGMTYTYVKRIVDNLFSHCQTYTINKPFVNTYTTINSNEFTDFYPNIDATDWDLEELLYNSGANSWVLDINGNLRRKSQITLYHESTNTSDLLQESNMRTLSQLTYLLQNKLDDWLLEYTDDGILASMEESINNIFSGWIGTRVQNLEIKFEKDINTDGGEIVVCYVNVTFRALVLRVPIIVNVQRRTS